MASHSFDELNKHVRDRLIHTDCYIGENHSFFKIFQHGVVYDKNKSKNKTFRTYFHLPLWIQQLYWFLRALKFISKKKVLLKNYLLLDPGRGISADSGVVSKSYFFHKIKSTKPNDHSVIFIEKEKKQHITHDAAWSEINGMHLFMTTKEKKMFGQVAKVAKQLIDSNYFSSSEKAYILSALHNFFHTYRQYSFILEGNDVKRCYFIAHYHNEGIIAALKDHGIEAIELQHGLISTNDLYYVYDSSLKDKLKNGFFPDRIIVFGPYWKSVLLQGCEFDENQIAIGGNFVLSPDMPPSSFLEKKNIVLVAAQKKMSSVYAELLETLQRHLQKHPEWELVVKLHPLEQELELYESCIKTPSRIAPLESSISEWLTLSKIQISVYSTTFYDAAGYEIMNFAWQKKGLGSDYALSMVESRIAEGWEPDEDPIALYNKKISEGYSFPQRTDIYAAFNPLVFE